MTFEKSSLPAPLTLPQHTLLEYSLFRLRYSSAPLVIFYLFILLFVSVSIPERDKGHTLSEITVGEFLNKESILKGVGRLERNQKRYDYTPRPPTRHLSHL